VWDALTNPERIPRWFLPVSGELRVGGRFQLQGNAGGTIERCEPPRTFAATWEFGESTNWIEVRLERLADGRTRLELDHTAAADDATWASFGSGAVGVGWDLAMRALTFHLSTGNRADPAAAEAWATSEAGKQFITLCSQSWAEANIAGGANANAAHEAAERTTKFYTSG
jgi:uncharacterized protein YndB with AHSA1/START domain